MLHAKNIHTHTQTKKHAHVCLCGVHAMSGASTRQPAAATNSIKQVNWKYEHFM